MYLKISVLRWHTQIGYLNLELSTQELIQKEEKQASSYLQLHFLEVKKAKLGKLVDEVESILWFLCNEVIKEAQCLQIHKHPKGIKVHQVH
jgi:hypothetical protein